jgi:putative oxidoreductase
VKRFLSSPWLTVRAQIALGAIFVIAALPKIADPPSFAHMIYNYRLVPGSLINISALIMPWVEVLAGLALILGVWKAAARNIIAALLAIFIIAISINLVRDNAIDCGCFNVSDRGKTHEQRIFDMKVDVARDLGMLLLVAQLWYAGKREESES